MGPRLLHVAALVATTSLGCGTTYLVQQSSLVPAPSGPPLVVHDGVADVRLANATVVHLEQPELAPNENAGLWVPRTQFEATLSLHPSRATTARVHYLEGLHDAAVATAATALPNPGRDVRGGGLGASLRVTPERHPWTMDVAVDYWLVSVPSFVRVTCVDGLLCGGGEPEERSDRDSIGMFAASLSARFPLDGGITLLSGAWLKTHPTNDAAFTAITYDGVPPSAQVESGSVNAGLTLGLELRPVAWFGVAPEIQVPLTAEPVRYAPIVGVSLRGIFGAEDK